MGCVSPLIAAAALCLSASAAGPQLTSSSPGRSSLTADAKHSEPASIAPPKETVSEEMRGDIFMARKRYRDAIDAYKSCPESPVIINKIGIGYHQMLELDSAKKQYERAIRMNPKYAEALNNLGTIYYAKKSYRRAIGEYKRALKLTPESASIYSNLGTAYWARKKYDEAMKTYERALALDSEVFEHRSTAGVLLQERPMDERAKFHFYQAKLYAKQGMPDRALLCLRKALEEGYKERDKIADQPEFKDMLELPEFKELMAYQPRVL
jgi:tetratricopeptide (TPR) repeat protein